MQQSPLSYQTLAVNLPPSLQRPSTYGAHRVRLCFPGEPDLCRNYENAPARTMNSAALKGKEANDPKNRVPGSGGDRVFALVNLTESSGPQPAPGATPISRRWVEPFAILRRRSSAAIAEGRHARNARFEGVPVAFAGNCRENCRRGVLKVQQASTPSFCKLLKTRGKWHRVFTGDPHVRRRWIYFFASTVFSVA